jgi:hypothetical protein
MYSFKYNIILLDPVNEIISNAEEEPKVKCSEKIVKENLKRYDVDELNSELYDDLIELGL